ncbi:heterokaryon incompatibility protein-domain-containing protein [Nemania abortiva]|nr:heterokaryon incompatibility protein-domain-containing protein [Nemania abortiva]
MRLINCNEVYRLESFEASKVPKYAILSHTWEETAEGESAEVTFQDFESHLSTQRNDRGWKKIHQTCEQARSRGLDYIWIDSCCIDKTNTTEFSEAINSMFQWYSNAAVCLVYLSDWGETTLGPCRWFRRGWTLQELVAPCYVHFYNSEWNYIGSKDDANNERLARITGIDRELLGATSPEEIRHRLSRTPICQRMSWASRRETSKIEDEAYCLLGIFDIHMPLLYGEGEAAFIRLQQMIARTTNDLTIFAWKLQRNMVVKHNPRNIMRYDPISKRYGPGPLEAARPEPNDYHSILACSPREFMSGGRIRTSHTNYRIYNPEFSITNKGLKIDVPFSRTGPFDVKLLPLNCREEAEPPQIFERPVGVSLRWFGGDVYARADIDDLPDALGNCSKSKSQNKLYLALSVNHLYDAIGTLYRNSIRLPDLDKMHPGMTEKKVLPGYMWHKDERLFVTYGHQSPFGCISYRVPGHTNVIFRVFFGLKNGSPFLCLADPSSKFFPAFYELGGAFLARVRMPAAIVQTPRIEFTVGKKKQRTSVIVCGSFKGGKHNGEPIHDLVLSVEMKREEADSRASVPERSMPSARSHSVVTSHTTPPFERIGKWPLPTMGNSPVTDRGQTVTFDEAMDSFKRTGWIPPLVTPSEERPCTKSTEPTDTPLREVNLARINKKESRSGNIEQPGCRRTESNWCRVSYEEV